MKIPLQINGVLVGEVEDSLSDDEIRTQLRLKLVRIPLKLINVTLQVESNLAEPTAPAE